MAILDLCYDRHIVFETKSNKRDQLFIKAVLRPEILKWISKHAVRHTIINHRNMQICIPDNQKAMLFKLTWM